MKKINEKKLMIITMFVVVLIVLLIFGITMLFGGAERVATKYAKGMSNFDANMIVSLYNDKMIKESYETKDEMVKEFDLMFKQMKDSYFQILKYDVDSNYKLYEGNELDYHINALVDYYKIDEKDIKEIRRYTVTFYCSDDGDSREVENKLNIAKIKNKWYLISTE